MNKNQKRLALMGLAASMLLFLSGCVSLDKSGNPTGWVWNLLGRPMSHVITYFAHNLRSRIWSWYYLRNHHCSFDYLATWSSPIS